MPYTLVSHTNAIRGRPTLKDVERFRNGLVHEFYSLKALKTLKDVNTSDVEKITDLDEQNLDVEANNIKLIANIITAIVVQAMGMLVCTAHGVARAW